MVVINWCDGPGLADVAVYFALCFQVSLVSCTMPAIQHFFFLATHTHTLHLFAHSSTSCLTEVALVITVAQIPVFLLEWPSLFLSFNLFFCFDLWLSRALSPTYGSPRCSEIRQVYKMHTLLKEIQYLTIIKLYLYQHNYHSMFFFHVSYFWVYMWKKSFADVFFFFCHTSLVLYFPWGEELKDVWKCQQLKVWDWFCWHQKYYSYT